MHNNLPNHKITLSGNPASRSLPMSSALCCCESFSWVNFRKKVRLVHSSVLVPSAIKWSVSAVPL